MENISKMAIDDSSASMYFSFNSTTAYKTIDTIESGVEISGIENEEDGEQNLTLEAKINSEVKHENEEVQTVKKLSFGMSPSKAIPKNILKAYKALSSTPTKAQLLRSVEINRGSAAVDVCDLGLAFLEAPQECINTVHLEDKENIPQESHEIYSETSSEIVVSVIEKTQLEEKTSTKRVNFADVLNLNKSSSAGSSNIKYTPRVRRAMPRCEPDLSTNRPSRIATKRFSLTGSKFSESKTNKELTDDEIPKMLNSILKISKGLPINRKSLAHQEKPFNLLGKATRMSIVKTTLNSPARKVARRSLTTVQTGKNPMRQSMVPINKRKSVAQNPSTVYRSIDKTSIPIRKSMLPVGSRSPNKRITTKTTRMSMLPGKPSTSSLISTSRKSIAQKTSSLKSLEAPLESNSANIKTVFNSKEEFICEVCSRKFRVSSLFEAHKRTHVNFQTSAKQSFSGNDKQCRYCDKKFAIVKALTNHLIQNCTKIPPGDKKKLLFPTDQLPAATANQKHQVKTLPSVSSNDSLPSNSTQSTRSVKKSDTGDSKMQPPSISKLKKKSAHSGVYCTPNKQILCHICKISFTNILAYTEHKLSHPSEATAETGTTSNESTQTHSYLASNDTQTAEEDGVTPLV